MFFHGSHSGRSFARMFFHGSRSGRSSASIFSHDSHSGRSSARMFFHGSASIRLLLVFPEKYFQNTAPFQINLPCPGEKFAFFVAVKEEKEIRLVLRFEPDKFANLIYQHASLLMFARLRRKWNVSGVQLALILCTFALGGSLCGYAGRKIIGLLPLEKNFLWYLIYILMVTVLWPFAVLLVSIPLGQFSFFRTYVSKILRRVGLRR